MGAVGGNVNVHMRHEGERDGNGSAGRLLGQDSRAIEAVESVGIGLKPAEIHAKNITCDQGVKSFLSFKRLIQLTSQAG